MIRRSTWEADLSSYILATRYQPFIWGTLDCALRAAGAVEAMTGVDPAAEYRGKYSTAAGAERALRRIGAGTLEASWDAKFDVVEPGFVRRGDIVWDGEAVGICVGAEALLFVEEHGGEIRVPRRDWLKGWRIG